MSTNLPVRVRFAPSPTGHLHIGGLRTAIFNWLFARHNNGRFLLRIEDTDKERSKPEYLKGILEAMEWMGLTPDEPLMIQSEQLPEHKKIIQQLLNEGKAYRCVCSAELVREFKEELMAEGKLLKYPGTCRNKNIADDGQSFVVRFKLPEGIQTLSFDDIVHGTITFDLNQFEDFIIARSDGTPMYNFVVVVDDATMKISHIIRGEEHILNTPKQILLAQACGFPVPQFAHIPLILGPSGNKLSKRDAAVAVIDYRKQGYLPDALYTYLVRLGWSHGDQEIFTKDELIAFFTLKAVGKKGSIFDPKKLDWVNSVYMQKADNQFLLDTIIEYIEPDLKHKIRFSHDQLIALVALYKERTHTLGALFQEITALYQRPTWSDYDMAIKLELLQKLEALIQQYTELPYFAADELSVITKEFCKDESLKLGDIAQPIRLALTGKTASPSVFELLTILGKDESIQRLINFVTFLGSALENK